MISMFLATTNPSKKGSLFAQVSDLVILEQGPTQQVSNRCKSVRERVGYRSSAANRAVIDVDY